MMSCKIRRPKGRRAESVKQNGNRLSVGGSRFRRSSSRFLHPFERPVKRMSPAGANPGDFDLGFSWFAFWNHLRWQRATVLDMGTHVTWASAPTRRATFASTKVAQNRLPRGSHQSEFTELLQIFFNVSGVIGCRHRTTMAPPSALLTQKISCNSSRSSD